MADPPPAIGTATPGNAQVVVYSPVPVQAGLGHQWLTVTAGELHAMALAAS